MQNEVMVRTVSGVSLGLAVLALTWFGGLPFKLLTVLIMMLVLFEWFRIVSTNTLSTVSWTLGFVTVGLTALCVLFGWAGPGIAASAAGAGYC